MLYNTHSVIWNTKIAGIAGKGMEVRNHGCYACAFWVVQILQAGVYATASELFWLINHIIGICKHWCI